MEINFLKLIVSRGSEVCVHCFPEAKQSARQAGANEKMVPSVDFYLLSEGRGRPSLRADDN